MSEQHLNPEQPVQGMYAMINGAVHRATVTMSDISVTTYHEVNLFEFDIAKVMKAFPRIAQMSRANIDGDKYKQDFTDLLDIVAKTKKTIMSSRSGDKITTYVVKQPVQSEKDGFLELSPYRREWWMENPVLQPIVESIQSYLVGFEPWRMQLDPYIRLFSKTSGLL